jgi:hypothetical protein
MVKGAPLSATSRRRFSGLKTTGTPLSLMRNLIESPPLILQHLRGRAPQDALASGLRQHVAGGVVPAHRLPIRAEAEHN